MNRSIDVKLSRQNNLNETVAAAPDRVGERSRNGIREVSPTYRSDEIFTNKSQTHEQTAKSTRASESGMPAQMESMYSSLYKSSFVILSMAITLYLEYD